MRRFGHYASRAPADTQPGLRSGVGLALLSAGAFGLSGPFARVLIETGWTPGAAVAVRVLGAALVLTPAAVRMMRGRWAVLRRGIGHVLAYGVLAVAITQLCYFYAVGQISVAVALLIEYTSPIAVVLWMWLRHSQRPNRRTVAGAVIAVGGLVLVLDVFATTPTVNTAGVLWSLGAMVGAAAYFVLSADDRTGLPPLVLTWAGLGVGGLVLVAAGTLRLLPMSWSRAPVELGDAQLPWWVPVLGLMLVTAALAYTAGIAAARRLGSRLASFVALTEVLAAVVYAWLLLGELPVTVQLAGGVLILTGVIVVRSGESAITVPPLVPDVDAPVER